MKKFLNIVSLIALSMSWQHMTLADADIGPNGSPQMSNTSMLNDQMPGQACPSWGCGAPPISRMSPPVAMPAAPVTPPQFINLQSMSDWNGAEAVKNGVPQATGPVQWLAQGYRYPSGLVRPSGREPNGMTYVNDQTGKGYFIKQNGVKLPIQIPTGSIQQRPPMYIVYDWLLKQWLANPNNNNGWYYLAAVPPTSPLSRDVQIMPDGTLNVRMHSQ